MARCFACNIIVEAGYDKKTDRWYCLECFEATNKVILSNLEAEDQSFPFSNQYIDLGDWVTDSLYPTDIEIDIVLTHKIEE